MYITVQNSALHYITVCYSTVQYSMYIQYKVRYHFFIYSIVFLWFFVLYSQIEIKYNKVTVLIWYNNLCGLALISQLVEYSC